jgi:hypothetical protein
MDTAWPDTTRVVTGVGGPQGAGGWDAGVLMGAFGAGPPVAPVVPMSSSPLADVPASPAHVVQAALKKLGEMGFRDEARNRQALAMFDNDVGRAAGYLSS